MTVQGIATQSKPPVDDTKTMRWKVELPVRASSPIQHGQVCCHPASGYRLDLNSPGDCVRLKRHPICYLDAAEWKVLWNRSGWPRMRRRTNHNDRLSEHGYATRTPACDGEAYSCLLAKAACWPLICRKANFGADAGKGPSGRGCGWRRAWCCQVMVIVNAADESSAIPRLRQGCHGQNNAGKRMAALT